LHNDEQVCGKTVCKSVAIIRGVASMRQEEAIVLGDLKLNAVYFVIGERENIW